MERKEISNALRSEPFLLIISLLIATCQGYSQAKPDSSGISLTFSARHPQANVPESPSDYLVRGFLDARRQAGQEFPDCFYGVDWVHFRLTAPNRIDSIRVTGDYTPNYLVDFFEARALTSQSYWYYTDRPQAGPIVVSVPVVLQLEGRCNQPLPAKFSSEVAEVKRLFEGSKQPLPALQGIQQGRRRVILKPIQISRVI